MQQSGGLLLAAVPGGKTLIFASGKNANESPAGHMAVAITHGKNANESPAGSTDYERPKIRISSGLYRLRTSSKAPLVRGAVTAGD